MTASEHANAEQGGAWEEFWREAPPVPGGVFWDAVPEAAVERHRPLFAPHFTGELPVLDLGCGNGRHSVALSRFYTPVLGIDISPAAVTLARRLPGAAAVDFRAEDLTDPKAAERLHAELGDSHVYVRGVIHQCTPEDRGRMAAAVARLAGDHGRAFVVEPSAAAKDTLLGLMKRPGGPPASLAAVFEHGIAPMAMADEQVPELFAAAGLGLLDSGPVPLTTTETEPDGSPVELPAQYLVLGRES
ncbi:class I SAM-dependent methyltransferase [Streptomyces sp. WMMC897]|uniref:class I SAM-dependent methyltransferase n=1 Tax=Streptomyces sp. WMMC897 TaxID=3014782 RepID=UPI0022B62532|nr:class I SAM-dependent methyltransferase [Streptomyces sp. WMMC897]MCZ7415837.1 class I SAM-dependent methyltransferase [Streptomyces sp. WMMC897]